MTFLKPERDQVALGNLFGDEVKVKGKIEENRFMDHKILLREATWRGDLELTFPLRGHLYSPDQRKTRIPGVAVELRSPLLGTEP